MSEVPCWQPKANAALAPVYVARQHSGFMGSLMASLGLGDSYFPNGSGTQPVQKMRPDQVHRDTSLIRHSHPP